MIQLRTVLVVAWWSVCAFATGSASAQVIRTVMLVGNEICLKSNDGQTVRLTYDGVPKALPVWSKDGSQIAFVERTRQADAVGRLKVITSYGNIVSETPIKPISAGEVQSGMRNVDSLEWLTPSSVAVSGAIDPSTTEYDILDLENREVTRQFFDYGHGAGLAPDGRHFAYVTGSPHFTPTDQRRPTLNVDDRAVYAGSGSELEFSGPPTWSQDSRSVAIPTIENGEEKVVIWHWGEKSATSVLLPVHTGSSMFSTFWKDGLLYCTTRSFIASSAGPPPAKRSFTVVTWVLQDHSWALVDSAAVSDVRSNAEVARKRLIATVEMGGGRDPDFWCADCDLSVLPRRSGQR